MYIKKFNTIFAPKGSKPRTTINSQRAGVVRGLSPFDEKAISRQKKILEVERQLEKANYTPMVPQNLQADSNTSSAMMSERRMVAPGSKDAPNFKSSKPEGLRRFIRLMEDLWKEAGVTKDESKKMMIGKYADPDSEEEWSAFDSFAEGTWEEFKEELIANYPEAAAAERGTPARIRQLCAETSKVRLGDMPALYRFRRAFLAEAKKLQKPPAVMANRELVELFIGCLSEALAMAVLQFLNGVTTKSKEEVSSKSKEGDSGKIRRPEDRYDLEDVCKAAIQVSENSQGMFNLMKKESSSNSEERDVFVFSQPVSESKALSSKVEELEGVQALERDRLVSMNKTIDSRMGGLEDMIKKLLAQGQAHVSQGGCKGDCKNNNCKAHESSSGQPQQKWGSASSARSMENEKCFWCGLLGHFQADCEDLKNHLRAGNVKYSPEGKLRLRDGSFIPNQPAGATLKERTDRHLARKPSQYFYGEYEESDQVSAGTPKHNSQYLNTGESAERHIASLEAEIELRKREVALELRKRKVELEEKKLEPTSGGTRAAMLLELLEQLTDEEIAAIKTAKSGFN